MKELLNLENSLKNSKDINFLRLVCKKNPAKSNFSDMDDNLLDLIYHSVLKQPINRGLGYGDLKNMKEILSKTIMRPIKSMSEILVEYDKYMEFWESRGVYYEYEIPVGLRETNRVLIPEAREYLKEISHSVCERKNLKMS